MATVYKELEKYSILFHSKPNLVWEKANIFERQRFLALLFVAAVAALLTYVLLASNFTGLNRLSAGILLLVLLTAVIHHTRAVLRRRGIRAPTGPLSSDERLKARAKLVKPGREK